ncbi:MAG: ATP-dependent protease, partial [Candidatus Aminicenantes bacterium]|nr:ATP-dependent protease [Candidatus Aminicenantes bacterium]
QPIGGVNEKVEGFFSVCKARSLTGDQGVIIPHQNVQNLMLNEEVVKAVEEGRYHIYPVKTIEEGITILTGVDAGGKQEDGTYPKGTINFLVDQELERLGKSWKTFASDKKEKDNNSVKNMDKSPKKK